MKRFSILMAGLCLSSTVTAGSFVDRVYAAGDVYMGDRVCGHALQGDWDLIISGRAMSCTVGDCGEFFCEDQSDPMIRPDIRYDGLVVEGVRSNHWLFLVTDNPEESNMSSVYAVYTATCKNSELYLDWIGGIEPTILQTYMIPRGKSVD